MRGRYAPQRQITHSVSCLECDGDITVYIYPGCAARTSGPPEDCFPEEPWDMDAPGACEHCGEKFSDRTINGWLEDYEPEEDCRDYEREIEREERHA